MSNHPDYFSIQAGDRISWHRGTAGGDTVIATVLAISADRRQVQMRVDGWAGTTWEILDHHMTFAR